MNVLRDRQNAIWPCTWSGAEGNPRGSHINPEADLTRPASSKIIDMNSHDGHSARPRPVRESQSQMAEVVLPNDANPLGNLLGGRLMHLRSEERRVGKECRSRW